MSLTHGILRASCRFWPESQHSCMWVCCCQVRQAAQHMAQRMAHEPEGAQAAVDAFHRWASQVALCAHLSNCLAVWGWDGVPPGCLLFCHTTAVVGSPQPCLSEGRTTLQRWQPIVLYDVLRSPIRVSFCCAGTCAAGWLAQ